MNRSLLMGAALGVVGGSLLIGEVAQAQEFAESDVVVVTATRREQALQDVPVAVSSINAEALVTRGIGSLADLAPGAIPGVQFSQFAGTPSILGIAIRGHGASDPGQGSQENPVALYIDGVFIGRAQGSGLDLIEPERIEVLRGPQGQLFGRNAEAGLVQYVSRKPSGEFGYNASASFGNYDSQRYRVSVDLPEFAGVALQISAIHNEHDAYTDNPGDVYQSQADYGYLDADGVRLAARWRASDNFTVDYTYDDSQSIDSQPALTWIPVNNGVPAVAPVPPSREYPDSIAFPLFNENFLTQAKGHALTLAWDVSDTITLKSLTSYRETSRHGSSTLPDGLPAGASAGGFFFPNAREDVEAEQTSQEFQFLGTWERFDFTAGLIYFSEEVTDGRSSRITGPGLSSTVGFAPAGLSFCAALALDPCLYQQTIQGTETESYGVYAQGAYTPPILNDRLEVTVGLRYSDDTKDAARVFDFALGGPLAIPQSSQFSATRWDPAVTIKYAWTEAFNTYLRYATAYRAGGANVRSSTFDSYEEEEMETWEIGAKSQLMDRRVTLNAALYHNTIHDQQLNIQEQPVTNPSISDTINRPGDYETTGLELEFGARVTDGLRVSFNYAYIIDSDGPQDLNNPFDPASVNRFYPINESEHSGSIAIDYVTQTFPVGEVQWHLDYSFSTGFWATPGGVLTNGAAPLPSDYERPTSDTSLLNARVAWAEIPVFGDARGEIAFWGKNLLDSTSIIYGFDGGAFGGGFAAYRQAPTTAGVEFRISY